MVEYKRVASQADPVLMEINGRFWGSLALSSRAGMRFATYEQAIVGSTVGDRFDVAGP